MKRYGFDETRKGQTETKQREEKELAAGGAMTDGGPETTEEKSRTAAAVAGENPAGASLAGGAIDESPVVDSEDAAVVSDDVAMDLKDMGVNATNLAMDSADAAVGVENTALDLKDAAMRTEEDRAITRALHLAVEEDGLLFEGWIPEIIKGAEGKASGPDIPASSPEQGGAAASDGRNQSNPFNRPSDAILPRPASSGKETPIPDSIPATPAKHRRRLRYALTAAALILALLAGVSLFHALTENPEADETKIVDQLQTEGAEGIEGVDMQGKSKDEVESVERIFTGSFDPDTLHELCPEAFIPGYVPEGYEFVELKVKLWDDGTYSVNYAYQNGKAELTLLQGRQGENRGGVSNLEVKNGETTEKGVLFYKEDEITGDNNILFYGEEQEEVYISGPISREELEKILDAFL